MHTQRNLPGARCPSPFALEKFVHGETTSRLDDHVRHCPRCSQRLNDMARQGEAYARSAEARRLRRELEAREAPERLPSDWGQRLRRGLVWGLASAATAAAVFFAIAPAPIDDPSPEGFVAKGGGVLRVIHQQGHVKEDWTDRDLRTRDALQLVWSAPESGFLAILGQTPTAVDVLFPEVGDQAASVRSGPQRPLGGSVIADAPTADLQLWAFFSPEPFSIRPLEEALRRRETPSFDGQTR